MEKGSRYWTIILISFFSVMAVYAFSVAGSGYRTQAVHASIDGRVRFSGNPMTNGGQTCTACHGTGAAVPNVTLQGPTTVDAGSTHTYSFTIEGGPAQTAGLNVSIFDNLGQLTPGNAETQILVGELTHNNPPKPFSGATAVFTFTWTAPITNGATTMYAAGNSSNGQSNLSGDGINNTSLAITIENGNDPQPPLPPPPPPPSTISLTQVVGSGELDEPVAVRHAGDERLFVLERHGYIRVVDEMGNLLSTPFLDIETNVRSGGGSEQGLLGLAFHPNYASNGYFYVYYTADKSGDISRISRFEVSAADANLANAGSELILMEFDQTDTNHNGGDLHFGPDGYLYIATGDGGGSGDPFNAAQTTTNLLGNILRIDVDSTTADGPDCDESGNSNYTIPLDNAFTDGPGGDCDEIWASGLRNPWRFSFDRATGDMWIADVGQNEFEEVNFVAAGTTGGLDFGWRCYEGNAAFNTSGCAPMNSFTFPVHDYAHDPDNNGSEDHCSVTGGFVYRGATYPSLEGLYFFADYCSAEIWTLSGSPLSPTLTTMTLAPGSNLFTPSSFGEDVNGELYVVNLGEGSVYRIEGSTAPTTVSIAGPTLGVSNTSYSFSAAVSPTTTVLPITFTWSATDQTPSTTAVSGYTSTIDFTWVMTGVKTITVTAENGSFVATDTHTITITVLDSHLYLPYVSRE